MLLKNIFALFLIFTFMPAGAQVYYGKVGKQRDSVGNAISDFDSSFLARVGKSAIELFIDNYVDSTNNLKKSGVFPDFLQDAQFDYSHSGWSPSHHPIPFRKMIISRVNTCQSLRMILEGKNEKYKNVPIKEYGIEVLYSNMSFYDLVLDRYKELNCIEMH